MTTLKNKKENHTIILIYAEKIFDEIQHLFLIMTTNMYENLKKRVIS